MKTEARRDRSRRNTRIQQDARARKARARAHLASRSSRRSGSRTPAKRQPLAPRWLSVLRRTGESASRARSARHAAGRSARHAAAPSSGWARLATFGAAGAAGLLCAWLVQDHGLTPWTAGEILPADARVDAISVLGNRRLDAAAVAVATGVDRGANLLDLDAAEVERHLTGHPWIAGARVLALPTGRLLVHVQERVPAAVHLAAGETHWRWVDATGTAFAEADPSDIDRWPRLEGGAAPDPETASSELAQAVELAAQARVHGIAGPVQIRLPEAATPDVGWVLVPADPALEALLGSEPASMPERIGRLARLLEEDAGRARRASHIDLRFSGRAFLRFAESGASDPLLHDAADASGGRARMRNAVRTGPTG